MNRTPIDLSIYPAEPHFFCPDEFWPAFGYDGREPFVAVWWDATTDEACWCDGRDGYIGADPAAYRLLLERNFPPGHPVHWLLGTATTPATMWLLVARPSGRALVVAADDGPALLAALNGVDEVEDTADDGMGVVVADLPTRRWPARGAWQEPALSPAEAVAEGALAQARHEALAGALQPAPV